jgi:hypothetical protein
MNNSVFSFIIGFLAGNAINLIELVFIAKLTKEIRTMLKQFKDEGKTEEWLK